MDSISNETSHFTLTPKEELAVICERLKQHIKESVDPRCQERLDIAAGIIRSAIYIR